MDMLDFKDGRPMEILFVEDSLMDARLAISALEKGGVRHRMTLVRDGEEALNFLQRTGIFAQAPRPDLILLDLRLPKVDGIDVLNAIRSDYGLSDIPVVIMTVSESVRDRRACEQLQVDAYVTKPINLKKFLSLVKELKHYIHSDVILPALE